MTLLLKNEFPPPKKSTFPNGFFFVDYLCKKESLLSFSQNQRNVPHQYILHISLQRLIYSIDVLLIPWQTIEMRMDYWFHHRTKTTYEDKKITKNIPLQFPCNMAVLIENEFFFLSLSLLSVNDDRTDERTSEKMVRATFSCRHFYFRRKKKVIIIYQTWEPNTRDRERMKKGKVQ
jgi:hypothetical protein